MAMSKVLAMLLLSLLALASTDARTLSEAEAPMQAAEAPQPSTSPIGTPNSSAPRPHQPAVMCDSLCNASVSECVVDSCLHIPAGKNQAACIHDCIEGLSDCQNDCQKAEMDDIKWPKFY